MLAYREGFIECVQSGKKGNVRRVVRRFDDITSHFHFRNLGLNKTKHQIKFTYHDLIYSQKKAEIRF